MRLDPNIRYSRERNVRNRSRLDHYKQYEVWYDWKGHCIEPQNVRIANQDTRITVDEREKLLKKVREGKNPFYTRKVTLRFSEWCQFDSGVLRELLLDYGSTWRPMYQELTEREEELAELKEKYEVLEAKLKASRTFGKEILDKSKVLERKLELSPTKDLEVNEVERTIAMNIIEAFRQSPNKEMFVTKLKFASGTDPLQGWNKQFLT